MMARVGLAVSLVLWVVGPRSATTPRLKTGTVDYGFSLCGSSVNLFAEVTTPVVSNGDWYGPSVIIPGVMVAGNSAHRIARVDHWLLCLTFLIATLATWRRKKTIAVQEEEGTNTDD